MSETIQADLDTGFASLLESLPTFAEAEAARISRRTKEALAAKKAQGFTLGNPNFAEVRDQGRAVQVNQADAFAWEMKPLIDACHKVGIVKLQAIADHLNEIGKPTRRGGTWHPMTVKNLLARIDKLTEERNKAVHGQD